MQRSLNYCLLSIQMPAKLYNSRIQQILILFHRLISSCLDLHNGVFGRIYRRLYYVYKSSTDRHLLTAAVNLAVPKSLVIDIGANIGFFSIQLAQKKDLQIIAFEPDQQNISELDIEIANRSLGEKIFTFNLALSDRTGIGTLYLSDLAPTDHKLIASRSTRALEIPITRLDDFMIQNDKFLNKKISLIKIDVQGAELLVLRGMRDTLKLHHFPPILVEYSPDDLEEAEISPELFFKEFEVLGYSPHSLPELTPQSSDWFIKNNKAAYQDLAMINTKRMDQ